MGILAKELQNIVNICNRTRCQFCREICPTYGYFKWETQAPRGRMNTAWNLLNGTLDYSERARDIIYSCELCSQCKETCPNGVDVPEVMLALRHEINTKQPHLLPAAAADLSSNVKHHGDIFGAPVQERTSWSTGVTFSKKNERVFFASCMGSSVGYGEAFLVASKGLKRLGLDASKAMAVDKGLRAIGLDRVYKRTMVKRSIYTQSLRNSFEVLKKLGVELGYLGEDEPCCGTSLHTYGLMDDFAEHAKRTYKTLKEKGVKEIVTANPICLTAFRDYYPRVVDNFDIEVRHVLDVMSEKINEKKLDLRLGKPLRVTYHDPCFLARYLRKYEEPRLVLSSIKGVELIEPRNSKLQTKCDGGGGPEVIYVDMSKHVAAERVKELLDTGAEKIVTSCPVCVMMLRVGANQLGVKADVMDVADLLNNAMA